MEFRKKKQWFLEFRYVFVKKNANVTKTLDPYTTATFRFLLWLLHPVCDHKNVIYLGIYLKFRLAT